MFRLIDKADENRGYVTAAIYSSKDRITGMLIDDVNQLTTFWSIDDSHFLQLNTKMFKEFRKPNYVLFLCVTLTHCQTLW